MASMRRRLKVSSLLFNHVIQVTAQERSVETHMPAKRRGKEAAEPRARRGSKSSEFQTEKTC